MTYRIISKKAGKTFTTKDPLKDNAWGNAYYGVDDCVIEVIQEPTPEELQAQEEKRKAIWEQMAFLASTDYKIIRQSETQEMSEADFNELKLQRQATRDKINQLEQGA